MVKELSDLNRNSPPESFQLVATAFREYAKKRSVQRAACEAVARLCSNNFRDRDDENRSASVVYGVLKQAVDVAIQQPDDAALQAAMCMALARACINDDARGSVMYVGGLEAVCSAMGNHKDDAKVIVNGCQAIGRMGEDFAAEDLLGDVCDIELDRQEHPHGLLFNTRMYRGRLRIDRFRRGPGGEQGELEQGGVAHVGDLIIKIGGNATFDLTHDEVSKLLMSRHVVLTVRCFPTDLFADEAEAEFREKLDELTAKKAARRKRIGEEGGIAVVMDAMQCHARDASVQQWGLFALAKVADQPENLRMISGMDGINFVIGRLRDHEQHSGVQEWGFNALRTVTFDDYSLLQAAANGGIKAVVAGLRRHPALSMVQRAGFRALAAVCAGNVTSRREALDEGVVEVAAATLATNDENEHVTAEVLEVVRVLVEGSEDGGDTDLRKEIGKQKGAKDLHKAIQAALKRFDDVESIQENGAVLQRDLAKGCVVM